MDCVFCSIPKGRILKQDDNFYLIEDKYPVSSGHLLIISKGHYVDFFALPVQSQEQLHQWILWAKEHIEKSAKPQGYNIGMNCGLAAGQTVMHFHCHVIPRFEGDMANPSGGIRHCVDGKGYY